MKNAHLVISYRNTHVHTHLLIKNLPSKSEDHHVPSCCLVPVGTICPLLPLQTAWFLAGPQMCSIETCSTCLVTHPYHSACSHLLTPARSSSLWRRMLTEASFSLSARSSAGVSPRLEASPHKAALTWGSQHL